MSLEERQRLTFILRVLLIAIALNWIAIVGAAWSLRIDSDKLEARIKALEAQAAAPSK